MALKMGSQSDVASVKAALLTMCDEVRDVDLIKVGVRLEDRLQGEKALWKLDDPELLQRELAQKVSRA